MSYVGVPPFGQTVRTITEVTATAGQTAFTPSGGYLPGYVDVSLNGIALSSADFTATNGTTVTLAAAAAVGDEFRCVAYWPVSLMDTYRKTETDTLLAAKVNKAGDTMTGALALTSGSSVGAGTYALLKFGGDAAADDFHLVRETSGFNLYSGVSGAGTKRFGVTSAGLVDLPNGQIKFPAAQNASSNANTLDDYEEGTWTPTFIVTYGSSSWGSYTQQVGKYIKIGRFVHCTFGVAAGSFSVGGNIGVSGLPFPVATDGGMTAGGARESSSTGTWYQAENVGSTNIGVLRRYDNGSFPNGSVSMHGFIVYQAES